MESFDEIIERARLNKQRAKYDVEQRHAQKSSEAARLRILAHTVIREARLVGTALSRSGNALSCAQRGATDYRYYVSQDVRPSKWNVFGNHYGDLNAAQRDKLRQLEVAETLRALSCSFPVWYLGTYCMGYNLDSERLSASIYVDNEGSIRQGRQVERSIADNLVIIAEPLETEHLLVPFEDPRGDSVEDRLSKIRNGLGELVAEFQLDLE